MLNFLKKAIKKIYFSAPDGAKRHELVLGHQQLAHALAALLMLFFFVFMAGYYWGKKSMFEPLSGQLMADSLSDKIAQAFSELAQEPVDTCSQEWSNSANNGIVHQEAQVGRFDDKKLAEACSVRLRKAGFDTEVKTQESTTAEGKVVPWYQVITHSRVESKDNVEDTPQA